jgi:hypothetical protein
MIKKFYIMIIAVIFSTGFLSQAAYDIHVQNNTGDEILVTGTWHAGYGILSRKQRSVSPGAVEKIPGIAADAVSSVKVETAKNNSTFKNASITRKYQKGTASSYKSKHLSVRRVGDKYTFDPARKSK